jgi:hypothetical protein
MVGGKVVDRDPGVLGLAPGAIYRRGVPKP